MKIIFDCEWIDHREGSFLKSRKPESEAIAYADDVECRVFYPEYTEMPCSSIEDGKAKIIAHLRDAGVLVEESDVNAELLEACKGIVDFLESGDEFAVHQDSAAIGRMYGTDLVPPYNNAIAAIAKAEGGK